MIRRWKTWALVAFLASARLCAAQEPAPSDVQALPPVGQPVAQAPVAPPPSTNLPEAPGITVQRPAPAPTPRPPRR